MSQPLENFLFKNKITKDEKNIKPTHTRIGDKDLNIYGGSYNITEDKLQIFQQLYYDYIFVNNKIEYLTEKQSGLNINIDLDFRYTWDINTRQHNKLMIEEIVFLYLKKIPEILVIPNDIKFDVFVMEKPNVNQLKDNSLTKDGIHITITLKMEAKYQLHLRKLILKDIPALVELPLINTWDNVLDEGISKLTTNWQLFGSRKPENEAYKLVYHYSITGFDSNDKEFSIEDYDNPEVTFDLFQKLSTQYSNNPKLEYKFEILEKKKTIKQPLVSIKQTIEDNPKYKEINYLLDKGFLDLINTKKDHSNFTKIGYAIYNTWGDEGLNLYLKMAESHSDNYDISIYTDRYKDIISKVKSNISIATIFYIFQEYDSTLYVKLMADLRKLSFNNKEKNINYYLDFTIFSQTEVDFANVLFEMYQDTYKCVDKDKKRWYYFNGVVWVEDKGITIRTKISVEMFNKYEFMKDNLTEQMSSIDHNTSDVYQILNNKCKLITEIQKKIKGTTIKNNIIKESMDLFYDAKFYDKLDNKPYLFAFNNCIFDLKTGLKITPNKDDYLSITCGYDYNDEYDSNLIDELKTIISTILFKEDVKNYYLTLLSTGLFGETLQYFHILVGSGGNGKSILSSLVMSCCGNYGYRLPSAILQSTLKFGGCPEVAHLHKKRFVLSQELNKNVSIKSSTVKELTGGDKLNARLLNSNNTEQSLNMTLVTECNEMAPFDETTDGAVRRVRVVDFQTKAIDLETYNELSDTDKESKKFVIKNTHYTSNDFRNKYKQALFIILLDYFKEFMKNNKDLPTPPASCLSKTRDYMATSDDIFGWFESYYERLTDIELKTEVDKTIKLTTVYSLFSCSDVFRNMTKEQKRSFNRKNFLQKIEDNSFLKSNIIYKDMYYNKEKITATSIYGWKLITNDA